MTINETLDAAERALAEKDAGATLEMLLALPLDQSTTARAYTLLVHAYSAQKLFENAVQAAQQFTENHSGNWHAFYLLGRSVMNSGDSAGALAPLRRATELNTHDARPLEALAYCCRLIGDKKQEYLYSKRFYELAPKKWNSSFFACRAAADLDLDQEASDWLEKANVVAGSPVPYELRAMQIHLAGKRRDRQLAYELSRDLTQQFPDRSDAFFIAGMRSFNIGLYAESTTYLQMCIGKDKKNLSAYPILIDALLHEKRDKAAIDAATAYISVAPDAGVLKVAEVYISLGRDVDALRFLETSSPTTKSKSILLKMLEIASWLGETDVLARYRTEIETNFDGRQRAAITKWFSQELDAAAVVHPVKGPLISDHEIKSRAKQLDVYVMPHRWPGFEFIRIGDFAVYVMEGLSNSVRIYSDFSTASNAYFFVQWPTFIEKTQLEKQIRFFEEITRGRIPRDRLIIMANDPKDVEICIELGLVRSFLCNNNCWIDFEQFRIISDVEKAYDLVINTRPEGNFKRPYLAAEVDDLAVIKGALVRPWDHFPLEQLNPKYINSNGRIPPSKVIEILNQSYCGGAFSSREGACYASSEYLLCGLPVISTRSQGGRDYWYHDDNSIVVEPTAAAVKEAVRVVKSRLLSGEWRPVDIRKRHVQESRRLRNIFLQEVSRILAIQGLNFDVQRKFDVMYSNKFSKNDLYENPIF